jgi:hypothetical protein
MFASNPALPTFFLALCLAAGPKNPQRDSLAKQLWQTFKRDMVQNFKAQLEDCQKHRAESTASNTGCEPQPMPPRRIFALTNFDSPTVKQSAVVPM